MMCSMSFSERERRSSFRTTTVSPLAQMVEHPVHLGPIPTSARSAFFGRMVQFHDACGERPIDLWETALQPALTRTRWRGHIETNRQWRTPNKGVVP